MSDLSSGPMEKSYFELTIYCAINIRSIWRHLPWRVIFLFNPLLHLLLELSLGRCILIITKTSYHINETLPCSIEQFNPFLTLNPPIATKGVSFSRLLKCLRSLYGKQCGPRTDCSYSSSLFWVHAVCFYT